ncbi:MAG TPA: extracellular solute-binding protein [Thermomicrobiales bacterium]|nr:extracellular solute-binding protein [Thermomicrobiales bacterium]
MGISRRSVLSIGALGLAAGFSGCTLQDNNSSDSTATPEPAPTEELSPTPTQPPIASPVAAYGDPARWEGRTLTVAAWGGDYQEAQDDAFFKPFSEATGATIQQKVADIGSLRNQVESEDVVWDVLTVPMEQMVRLARDNVLTPMNYDVVDRTPLYQDIALEYGVGVAYFSATMIYGAGSTNAPQDWTDFWNVAPVTDDAEIPVEDLRCLRRYPIGTLEFALLADGVPIEGLYPIDADRAFASLDKIRDYVLVWWQESKEPAELIAAQAVSMASSWNVRIPQLDLTDEVRINWYDGMLSADAWIVPRGAQNTDVAFDFINFATRAVPQANFALLVPYGPVNIDAFPLIRNDRVAILPSAPGNKPLQFVEDWSYWAEYEEKLTARFEAWILSPEGTPEPSDSPD